MQPSNKGKHFSTLARINLRIIASLGTEHLQAGFINAIVTGLKVMK